LASLLVGYCEEREGHNGIIWKTSLLFRGTDVHVYSIRFICWEMNCPRFSTDATTWDESKEAI